MDPTGSQHDQHRSTVRVDRTGAIESVLSAAGRERTESAADAIDRRAIHKAAVLRSAENDLVAARSRTRGQSQASRAIDARDGTECDLSQAATFSTSSGAPNLPLPVARSESHASQPGVEHRHHLHPDGARIRVFDGDYGLVQPLRARVENLDDDGHRLLRCGIGVGSGRGRAALCVNVTETPTSQ